MQAVGYSLLVVCLALYAGCVLSQTDLPTPASEPQPEEKPAATVTEIPEPTPKPQSDCTAIFDLDKKYKSPRGDVEASGTDLTVQGEKYECVTYFVDNLIFNSAMGYKCWSILRQSPGSYLVTDRTVEAPSVEDPKNITESEVCVAADAAIPPNKRWTMIKTGEFYPSTCSSVLKDSKFSVLSANGPENEIEEAKDTVLDFCERKKRLIARPGCEGEKDCKVSLDALSGVFQCASKFAILNEGNETYTGYQLLYNDKATAPGGNFLCMAARKDKEGEYSATLKPGLCGEDQNSTTVSGGLVINMERIEDCSGCSFIRGWIVLIACAVLTSLAG